MRRQPVRRRTVLAAALACALLAAAVALAGCGRAEYVTGPTVDLPAVVAQSGATVLDQGTAENYYPGGEQAHWYLVSRQGSDEPAAVLSVLTFDSRAARDAAARDLDNSRRAGARREGVYTFANAVVVVGRITDKATVRQLDEALRAAGMK